VTVMKCLKVPRAFRLSQISNKTFILAHAVSKNCGCSGFLGYVSIKLGLLQLGRAYKFCFSNPEMFLVGRLLTDPVLSEYFHERKSIKQKQLPVCLVIFLRHFNGIKLN